MLWVVAYDIPINKCPRRVPDLLFGYEKRVQYNAFECDLSEQQFLELKTRLERIRIKKKDSFRPYPIINNKKSKVLVCGKNPPLKTPRYYYAV